MDEAQISRTSRSIFDWLAGAIVDPDYEISLGAFGAVGQFPREPRTYVDVGTDRIVAATASAGIALDRHNDLRPIAFEMLSSDPGGWNHAIALCLPAGVARMSGRMLMTPIGLDAGAIDAADRTLRWCDLGLGTPYADICVRPCSGASDRFVALARDERIVPDELPARYLEDVWIFKTALGRIETRDTGRRHVLPRLLSKGLTHSIAAPIPAGFVPVGYVFPPNPRRCGYQDAMGCHRAFQSLLDRFGTPDLVLFKREVERALDQGRPPEQIRVLLQHSGRPIRSEIVCIKVALRQRRWLRRERDRPDWEDAYDRPLAQSDSSYTQSGA